MNRQTFFVQISAASLIVVLCATTFAPKPAYAAVPSFEVNPAVVGGIVNTSAQATLQTATLNVLNGIAWAVAKATIQSLTRSMVNWINSGFNGSPAFVTDLNRNLTNLSDAVANDFFNSLQRNEGINVRSPFQDQVTNELRNVYYGTGIGSYNLNRYSTNPQAFYNGRLVGNGGFNAWFAALNNDQNNPFGALRSQERALGSAINSATGNRLQELNWGRGFLSWRGNCTATKSSADLNADILSGTSLSAADNCASYEIKTPGSIVEDSLGITVNSPLRQLELADSINEIVAALAGQLVNQVLGGGGLSGLSQPSVGGGPSYISQATNPSAYLQGGSSAGGLIATITQSQTDAQNFLSGWQKIQSVVQNCSSSDSVVSDTKTKANTNITRANTAIAALNKLSTEATAAVSSTDPTASLSAVSTEYQNLLSAGTIISSGEAADAQANSDTTADSSLVSQIKQTCGT